MPARCLSRPQPGSKVSVFLEATVVLKRSSRLRVTTIFGEVVSITTLTCRASGRLAVAFRRQQAGDRAGGWQWDGGSGPA